MVMGRIYCEFLNEPDSYYIVDAGTLSFGDKLAVFVHYKKLVSHFSAVTHLILSPPF